MHGRDISLLSNPEAQYKQLQFLLEFTMNEAQNTGVDSYIKELERLGIGFANTSTEDAKKFLTTNTYYQKLRAYLGRTPQKDDFGGMDFQDLVELSKIDFSVSRQVLTLALAIEHALKIQIWHLVESEGEDFLNNCLDQIDRQLVDKWKAKPNSSSKRKKPEKFSEQKVQTTDYSRAYLDAPSKHKTDRPYVSACALWELLESLSFPKLIDLYDAALQEGESEKGIPRHYLKRIQELRNAAAHENCLLVRTSTTGDEPKEWEPVEDCHIDTVFPSCFHNPSISHLAAEKKQEGLSRLFLHDFCILLYVHDRLVESTGMKEHARRELEELRNRIAYGDKRINNNQTSFCQLKSEINTTLSGVIDAIDQFIALNQSASDDC